MTSLNYGILVLFCYFRDKSKRWHSFSMTKAFNQTRSTKFFPSFKPLMPREINILLARPSHISLRLNCALTSMSATSRLSPRLSICDFWLTFRCWWVFKFSFRDTVDMLCSWMGLIGVRSNKQNGRNTQLKKFQPQSIDDWADAGNKKRQLSSRSVRPDCRVHQTETEKKKKSKVFSFSQCI